MSTVRSHMRRLCISLVGFPLVLMALTAMLSCANRADECTASDWIAASLIGPGVMLVVFPFVALLIVAAVWLLLRFRLVAWWHFVLAGAVVGAASAFPFIWHVLANESLRWAYRLAALSDAGLPSATCATLLGVFWLLAVWRNRAFA